MKYFFTIFLYLISPILLRAQTHMFTIKGTIQHINSGKLFLIANSFEKKYYGENHTIDSANIINGKFEIQKNVFDDKQYAYRFIIQSDSMRGVTDLVFIASKNQTVIIDSINEHIAPIILGSSVQDEMKYEFNEFFKNLINEVNDLNNYEGGLYKKYNNNIPKEKLLEVSLRRGNLSSKSDSLFFIYSIKHPDSYVTLWKLIERFNNIGYRNEYSSIYNLLSNDIKNTQTGKLFQKDLNVAKLLALKNPFPKLKLKNLSLQDITLDSKDFGKKITLIDFWFSHCAPCLREFPLYKKL